MKRIYICAFLLILLVPAMAQPVTLDHLLEVQKKCWSPAWVSSGFHDWRTVSKYRRRAGLHLGYDIAMPFGSPVAAAWTGKVVAVTPWTSTEYGITVRSPQGWEVTYGHIAPEVSVGKTVHSGTLIGTIASDHVDVKMRDATGAYVAFDRHAPAVALRAAGALIDDYVLQRRKKQHLELRQKSLRKLVKSGKKKELSRQAKLTKGQELAKKGLLSRRELQTLKRNTLGAPAWQTSTSALKFLRLELESVNNNLDVLIAEARRREIQLPETLKNQEVSPPKSAASVCDRLKQMKQKGLISGKEWQAARSE